jgi:hypothetical protein
LAQPENKSINKLLNELTPEQKEVVAQMLQQARDGGIHDVLVYLHNETGRRIAACEKRRGASGRAIRHINVLRLGMS